MTLFARILATFAMLIAAPALGTPPTVVTVSDEPFGLSETEFFVLRTTTDNLGSYYEARHETYLVATNLETREQVYWHVDSVQVSTDFASDGDEDRRVMKREAETDSGDAFAILRARDGLPWNTVGTTAKWLGTPQVQMSPTAAMLTYPQGPTFELSRYAAEGYTAVTGSLLIQATPNYARTDSISTREVFAFRRFVSEACTYEADELALGPLTDRYVQLFRVTCSDEEELDGNSLLIPVISLRKSDD